MSDGTMDSLSSSDDIFYDLVNMTADEWNQSVAASLDYTVEDLRELITARGLVIATKRTHIDVERNMITALADIQQDDDKRNVQEYNTSPSDDVIYRATLLDKFTITLDGADEEINSIALTGKILVGLDFSNGDFSYSYLCHCDFYNCVFDNASLENMVISNCTFTQCSFVKVDFTSSAIARSRFFETNLDESSIDYTSISDCSFVVSTLNDVSFMQSKILYTGFSDCEGNNSEWRDADIIQCSFSNTQLNSSDFKRATLVDDIFIRVDLTDCDFSSSTVTCLTVTMCEIPEEYNELFEVNHLLYSPAIFEWEPSLEDDEDDISPDGYDDDDDDDDEEECDGRPW